MDTTFQPNAYENLNFLEKLWFQSFQYGDEWLVITVISFVFHEIVYFGRFIPFWICDFIPSMKKYKIQQDKENSSELLWKCFKGVMFNHFFVELPLIMLFHPFAGLFGMEIQTVPFPSWTKIALQVLIFMFFEDFFHYWAHRLLHYGILYKKIHKVHHEFSAPFGITAEYAHPLEVLILGFATVGGPVIWVMATGDLHIFTMLVWISVRLLQTVDAHSGYDFPWSLRRWLPFWAGADFHDYHHMAFVNCYATSFRWWDQLCGTDKRYKAFKAQKSLKTKPKAKKLA